MDTQLVLHRGGQVVTREQVFHVQAPPATDTWHPVAHGTVLAKVEQVLDAAGYNITRQQLALSHGGDRFFGVLDLESAIIPGIQLALGLRNSIDKSFPYGLAGGTRTFVCDNLALTGDWDELTIARKHTRNGEQRFAEAISHGISKLTQYRDHEATRVTAMQQTMITDQEAESCILRAYEADLLSHRVLKDVLKNWRDPGYDWGGPTLWALYNAMNLPIQHKSVTNPQAFSHQTMKLIGLVAPNAGDSFAAN